MFGHEMNAFNNMANRNNNHHRNNSYSRQRSTSTLEIHNVVHRSGKVSTCTMCGEHYHCYIARV